MQICDDCKKEYDGYTCKNCGLVSEEKDLVLTLPRIKEGDKELTWSHPLSPSLEFNHIQPKRSGNSELNKALFWQNRKQKKSADDYYIRAYNDMKSRCNVLHLPNTIKLECYNIVKNLISIKDTYLMYGRYDYKYSAIIRLACKLNDIYLDERELVKHSMYYHGEPLNMRNSPIKKNIDREYILIKRALKIRLRRPDMPRFISHACNVLEISQIDETRLYVTYSRICKRFDRKYKLDGYLLALIYTCCRKYKIGLGKLETLFGIARDTIRSRKKEIEMLLNDKKENT